MTKKTQRKLRIIKIILLILISVGFWILIYNYQDVYQEIIVDASNDFKTISFIFVITTSSISILEKGIKVINFEGRLIHTVEET